MISKNHPSSIRQVPSGGKEGEGGEKVSLLVLRRLHYALDQRGAEWNSLFLIAAIGLIGSTQAISNVPLVIVLLGVVFYEFQKRMDQGLPLMQIAAIVSILQWTVGPILACRTTLVEGRYSMYVSEANYFSYALPGTAAYVFGLLAVGFSVRQREVLRFIRRDHFMAIGIVLNGIAMVCRFAADKVPGGLAFLLHLLSQLGYVGALYFLFSRNPNRWLWIALSLFPLLKTTTESAMFHDIILWFGLLFCYWYGIRKHDLTAKAGFLGACCLTLFTIQAVKQEYRAKVWGGEEASLVGQMVDFWSDDKAATSDGVLANVITRLNQGWIISAVLNHVPAAEPFADGETIKDALVGAFVPRVIMAGKAKAGGQLNFRRFTGLDLADSTSMAVSPLGEAYANFGKGGGIVLMLGSGLVFASFFSLCLKRSVAYPTFLFWIPLIFYQAIKAETEFVTVLNQVTKGSIVAFGLHWLIDLKWISSAFPSPRQQRKRKLLRTPAVEPEATQ